MKQPDESEPAPRLDVIETQWSLVQRAHQGTIVSGNDARQALVMRYSPAIRSYVKAMTRDDQEADEISQDVVVRLLQGDFAGADPQRGRFRDLLKVAVRNMVRNHWAKQNRRRGVDIDLQSMQDEDEPEETDEWLVHWRANVLEIAWSALERYQRTHAGSISYTVLRLRADAPQDNSEQLAAKLSRQLGNEVRSDSFRQQLRRARVRFAQFIVAEIASGMDRADPTRIQEELISLGIYEHVKDVVKLEA